MSNLLMNVHYLLNQDLSLPGELLKKEVRFIGDIEFELWGETFYIFEISVYVT